eukprot:scpid20986/ scgid7715/ 
MQATPTSSNVLATGVRAWTLNSMASLSLVRSRCFKNVRYNNNFVKIVSTKRVRQKCTNHNAAVKDLYPSACHGHNKQCSAAAEETIILKAIAKEIESLLVEEEK